jgi:hypothetical protein
MVGEGNGTVLGAKWRGRALTEAEARAAGVAVTAAIVSSGCYAALGERASLYGERRRAWRGGAVAAKNTETTRRGTVWWEDWTGARRGEQHRCHVSTCGGRIRRLLSPCSGAGARERSCGFQRTNTQGTTISNQRYGLIYVIIFFYFVRTNLKN